MQEQNAVQAVAGLDQWLTCIALGLRATYDVETTSWDCSYIPRWPSG